MYNKHVYRMQIIFICNLYYRDQEIKNKSALKWGIPAPSLISPPHNHVE